ncbi:SGNH/GDSL hydrolase family protein [Acidihalobacter ferrooxydans]|uniref:GDSL family lipase n=1 Tax=Acidihalobacter ferrooxydans TaxID=1765967 RepID=A0A1P8UJ60_9GAMM|nr:SGNH/GDSL hydrolase family protein [Acidihalobacter ferrooxydans]APZ43876.1 GDSL family lipase [Acidihalobacter ferrooxydans]
MIRRALAALCFAAGLGWGLPAQAGWVGAWYMAPQAVPQAADAPPYLRAPWIDDATVREIVRPTIAGTALRLRISNRYGVEPLHLGAVTVGVARGIGAVVPGTLRRVTFGGRSTVVIPPGGAVVSDPVPAPVVARRALAVSLYVPGRVRPRTWHQIAGRVNFLSARGDHSRDASGAAFLHRNTHILWLDGVDVRARHGWAVVAIGDSITDGLRATLNAQQRWPDALSRRLRAAGIDTVAVLNAGISGNRLLHDSACYGQSLEARFARDALDRPGVRAVIVLIGINDINFADMPPRRGLDCDAPHARVSAADLIDGYRRLIAQAHARGVKIYAATLTPAALPATREAVRRQVNAWLRNSGAFDGVADFDAALRDPLRPARLRPQADSGDGIHPSDAGDRMLADAVPLAWFRSAAGR